MLSNQQHLQFMVIFWFLVDKQVAKQDFCLSMLVDHSSKPAVRYGPLDNCLASYNGFPQKETTAREVLKLFCHSDPYDKVEVATGQSLLTWHHNLGWLGYQSKGSKTSAPGGAVINQQMLLLEASYLQNTCGSYCSYDCIKLFISIDPASILFHPTRSWSGVLMRLWVAGAPL